MTRADWFDPELCPKVRSFAQHYGIAILPTRPYTPRHKGKIEAGVKYVKRNALKALSFASLAQENAHLAQWESTVADTRIHGTTRQQVLKVFTELEKPALLPLPPDRFGLFAEALRTVHRDGHVQVQGAYYSLPPEYLGQNVWARWDGRTVRLFDQKMRPITVHAQKPPGAFSTIPSHIHPHKISSIEKGTAQLLGQAGRIGPQAQAWAEGMLRERGIEGVRVLMGLLSLAQKHPRQQIEMACQIAAGHGAWHLRSLRRLIERQTPPAVQQSFEFVQQHPIKDHLEARGLKVRGITTDGSGLYPDVLKELFPGVPHQICQFHVLLEINRSVLRALAKVRKELRARCPKFSGGGLSKAQRKQARRRRRIQRQIGDLFEHRHLFVQRRLTVAQGRTLQRITRGLPQLRVLRQIMDEVYRLFDRRCRTETALAKLARLRRRVRRFRQLAAALGKLFTPSLEKALNFLDDRLLPATSNAVERGNRRYRKAQRSVYSVRTAEHIRQRIALDMQREQQGLDRRLTTRTLHEARARAA